MKDSGSDFKDVDPYRAGVIIGVGIGGLNLTEQEHAKFLAKPDKISVFYIPMMIANMAAGTVSMKTGFKGDNFATVTACASGTHAIGEAFRKIKDGYLDVALAGGSESCISRFALSGFNNMKALSREENPEKASTPFDLNRKGFVLGEGCGVLVLEEYEHAKARGAKIYAEIAGYGATCDAYHMTSPSPTGEAAAAAMKHAYEEAGLSAEDVTYINAHGTSTHLNDAYETTAIKIALGEEAAKKVVINSTKSMTGHLLGAAGAVEAIVTALSIQNDFVHKTLGYETPDPECDLDYCVEGNREITVNAALSNSLGFGGHNATLCLKKVTD
jgi:3-oxoacyl-[acyl-carrier-protein] synthase II